LKAVETDLIDF